MGNLAYKNCQAILNNLPSVHFYSKWKGMLDIVTFKNDKASLDTLLSCLATAKGSLRFHFRPSEMI